MKDIKEKEKILKEMFIISIILIVSAILCLMLFKITGKFFIHPSIYILLIFIGLGIFFTGLTIKHQK